MADTITEGQPSKPFWKSKTFWLNVAGIAVTAGSGGLVPPLTLIPGVAQAAQFLGDHPQVSLGILAGGNIALRALTYGPIHVLDPFTGKE